MVYLGTLGRAVACGNRDPRFESSHRLFLFTVKCSEETKIKTKGPRLDQFFVKIFDTILWHIIMAEEQVRQVHTLKISKTKLIILPTYFIQILTSLPTYLAVNVTQMHCNECGKMLALLAIEDYLLSWLFVQSLFNIIGTTYASHLK